MEIENYILGSLALAIIILYNFYGRKDSVETTIFDTRTLRGNSDRSDDKIVIQQSMKTRIIGLQSDIVDEEVECSNCMLTIRQDDNLTKCLDCGKIFHTIHLMNLQETETELTTAEDKELSCPSCGVIGSEYLAKYTLAKWNYIHPSQMM